MSIQKRIIIPAFIATSLIAFSNDSHPASATMPDAPLVSAMDAGIKPANELASSLVKVAAPPEVELSIDAENPTSSQLTVWIGNPSGKSGNIFSARITPQFPDDPFAFRVEPENKPCQAIEPPGTEVQFTITPASTGQFRVGASVELYEGEKCQGAALTKTAAPVTITVTNPIPPQVSAFPEIAIDWPGHSEVAAPVAQAPAAAPAQAPVADRAPASLPPERELFKAKPAFRPMEHSGNQQTLHAEAIPEPSPMQHYPAAAGAAPPSYESSPRPITLADDLVSYLVKVQATEEIKMSLDRDRPSSGQLTVWIGSPSHEPQNTPGMAAASKVLQASQAAASAKVTPRFPDDPSAFQVEPENSPCQAIDPTGTEVPFTITPMRKGHFRVGASVELYRAPGCLGETLTKAADPVTVNVTIYAPQEGILEIIWSAIKKFIGEILTALFAVLIIVFRKKLMKLFGIKEEP